MTLVGSNIAAIFARHPIRTLICDEVDRFAPSAEFGIDYYKRTPSIHFDDASLLAKKMDEMGSGFFMTDCGLVNPPRVQGNNWFVAKAL